MRHKVNPHTLRVGVIRDWDSKWEPTNSGDVVSSEQATLNGERFKSLNVTSNLRIYGHNKCDVNGIVKKMQKR